MLGLLSFLRSACHYMVEQPTLPTINTDPSPYRRPQPIAAVKSPVAVQSDCAALPSRILVADDDVVFATGLTRLLSKRGNDVRTAFNGLAAIELAEAFQPHFVLLDIDMPKIGGYEAARTIRARGWAAAVVLIAITGHVELDNRPATRAAFDHHFSKPVDLPALESILRFAPK